MSRIGSKLALGSANFGLDYGIKNDFGKISSSELSLILSEAQSAGIEIIDTAQAYGDSEKQIGANNNSGFDIVTKIGVGLDKSFQDNCICRLVSNSLERLNQSSVYAVMLHRPEVLLSEYGNKIVNELEDLKAKNVVSKIGVSIYSPDILHDISGLMDMDIIQAPFNIFDQRLLVSGWSEKLKDKGIEIHSRSVFLQGLLLLSRADLPAYFIKNWPDIFIAWFNFVKNSGTDAGTIALSFALKQSWVDKVVVGVDSSMHLKNLIEIENSPMPTIFPNLKCDDERLIDPSEWKFK